MSEYKGMTYGDSSTLAGIREDIYFLGKVNSSSISANDLNRIINKYYSQMQEVVRSINENFYMQVATTNLVIGDGSYSYPDGTGTAFSYEQIKSIWVARLPADKSNPQDNEFERVNITDPNLISDPAYEFTTPTALMFGTYFVLKPLLTDATLYPVTNGVKMYYIAEQDKLTNDTDVPKIFPSFRDIITHGSLIDVATRLGNDTLKNDSAAFFKKRMEELKSYASSRLPDEIGLVEGQDELGGWEYPFGNNSMS